MKYFKGQKLIDKGKKEWEIIDITYGFITIKPINRDVAYCYRAGELVRFGFKPVYKSIHFI